eukprot:757081-Hanusia_phi.AAC.1
MTFGSRESGRYHGRKQRRGNSRMGIKRHDMQIFIKTSFLRNHTAKNNSSTLRYVPESPHDWTLSVSYIRFSLVARFDLPPSPPPRVRTRCRPSLHRCNALSSETGPA